MINNMIKYDKCMIRKQIVVKTIRLNQIGSFLRAPCLPITIGFFCIYFFFSRIFGCGQRSTSNVASTETHTNTHVTRISHMIPTRNILPIKFDSCFTASAWLYIRVSLAWGNYKNVIPPNTLTYYTYNTRKRTNILRYD